MNFTKSHYQIALSFLFGFGPVKTRQLLQSVDEIEEIFLLSFTQLSRLTRFKVDILKKMNRDEALDKAVNVLKDLERFDIDFVFYTDPQYPRRLKQCEDAPIVLYTRGTYDLNDTRFVAIVGTRDATDYGRKICQDLIESFRGTNIVVVSGMAYGIDITIHQLCIENGVDTIGVMAHGLEIVYPSLHRGTAKKMLSSGGLLSEYPPNTNPDRENFPMRNRIVAGLCDATIVVESKLKGGSLITADLANDYNRDVFAFPGNVFDVCSEGCNQLIAANKAHLVRNGLDFLTKMGWDLDVKNPVQKSIFPSLNVDEQLVVNALEFAGQKNIDMLATELNLPSSKLSVLLFQLEMNGVLKTLPGNRCQLV